MDDQAYYLHRARQEEEAARLATCRAAHDRHDELASAYRLRARLIPFCAADEPAARQPQPGSVPFPEHA